MFRILVLSATLTLFLTTPAEANGIFLPAVVSGMVIAVALSLILGLVLATSLDGTGRQRFVTFCAAPFFTIVSAVPLMTGCAIFMHDEAPASIFVTVLSLVGGTLGCLQLNTAMQKTRPPMRPLRVICWTYAGALTALFLVAICYRDWLVTQAHNATLPPQPGTPLPVLAATILAPLAAIIAARRSKKRLEAFFCAIAGAGVGALFLAWLGAWETALLVQQTALPLACVAAAIAGAFAADPLPPRPLPGGHPLVVSLIAAFLFFIVAAPSPLTLLLPFPVLATIFGGQRPQKP